MRTLYKVPGLLELDDLQTVFVSEIGRIEEIDWCRSRCASAGRWRGGTRRFSFPASAPYTRWRALPGMGCWYAVPQIAAANDHLKQRPRRGSSAP
jgi:hypothetical protein